MRAKETAPETNKHSHKLIRANLHACSTCGRLVATTFRERTTGEVVMEELEFDIKIVSSRISRLHTTGSRSEWTPSEQPSEANIIVENTCW